MRLLNTVLVCLMTISSANALAIPVFHKLDSIVIGGEAKWDYIYSDNIQQRIYVSHGNQTEVIDAHNNKRIGTIYGTTGVHGIATAPDLGVGYTSNGKDDSVTVFDLATLAVKTTIKVGKNPDAIIYYPATQKVITFNGHSKNITIINAKNNDVIATVDVAGKPEFAQISEAGNIYFNLEDTNELAVLDIKTMKLTHRYKLTGCESPSGLTIDLQQRIYSVCENKQMIISKSNGQQIAKTTIGGDSDGVAWLDGFALSANGEDGTISIVGETPTGKIETLSTMKSEIGARTIAANPQLHRLYLPTADFSSTTDKKHHGVENTFRVLVFERE